MLNFKTVEEFDLRGKTVILRVDFNVPVDKGVITDDSRIVKSMKTINYILKSGAESIIVMSHMGKIKKEEDKSKNTLKIVVPRLEELLKEEVDFLPHTSGRELIDDIEKSHNRVKLMENTRFEDLNGKRESGNSEELGEFWASLGDVAIFDAFGVSHRNHASSSAMFKYIECGIGYLMQEEMRLLDEIINEDSHPFALVLGGAKVSDKTLVIKNLIDKCDHLFIGGAMAFTFLKSLGYDVGRSLVDDDNISFCENLMVEHTNKIHLPVDVVTENGVKLISEISSDEMGLDIGPRTIELFKKSLKDAKRIFANGTMGKNEDEKYAVGSKELLCFLADLDTKVLVGGGDTVSAVSDFGLKDKILVSTGGGASLAYLGGELGSIFEILKLSSDSYEKGKKRNKKISD